MIRTSVLALVLVVIASLAACGGSDRPAPEAPAEPGRCTTVPEVEASRRPAPQSTGCMDRDRLQAQVDACQEGGADDCYQVAVCEASAHLGGEPDAEALANLRRATRISCDGGIAEACLLRIGAVTHDGAPPPDDQCVDLVRACQLGDAGGCLQCQSSGCD